MRKDQLPNWVSKVIWVIVITSWIPLAMIYADRQTPNSVPRVSIIPDMDNQQKFKAQQANLLFADMRADRPPVFGTVARGELNADRHFYEGRVGEGFAQSIPSSIEINQASLDRGKERYQIYCAPCHGYSGYGNGMVAVRADELALSDSGDMAWTPPQSMHDPVVLTRPDGYYFNVITHGVRSMGPYGSQITPEDRWKIVLYIRLLQKSQNAGLEDLPASVAAELEANKPAAPAPAEDEAGSAESEDPALLNNELTDLQKERFAPDANLSPEQQAEMDQQIADLQAKIDAQGADSAAGSGDGNTEAAAGSDTSEAGN